MERDKDNQMTSNKTKNDLYYIFHIDNGLEKVSFSYA